MGAQGGNSITPDEKIIINGVDIIDWFEKHYTKEQQEADKQRFKQLRYVKNIGQYINKD